MKNLTIALSLDLSKIYVGRDKSIKRISKNNSEEFYVWQQKECQTSIEANVTTRLIWHLLRAYAIHKPSTGNKTCSVFRNSDKVMSMLDNALSIHVRL